MSQGLSPLYCAVCGSKIADLHPNTCVNNTPHIPETEWDMARFIVIERNTLTYEDADDMVDLFGPYTSIDVARVEAQRLALKNANPLYAAFEVRQVTTRGLTSSIHGEYSRFKSGDRINVALWVQAIQENGRRAAKEPA